MVSIHYRLILNAMRKLLYNKNWININVFTFLYCSLYKFPASLSPRPCAADHFVCASLLGLMTTNNGTRFNWKHNKNKNLGERITTHTHAPNRHPSWRQHEQRKLRLFLQSPANPDLLYIIIFCHTQLTVTLLLALIFGSKVSSNGVCVARLSAIKWISFPFFCSFCFTIFFGFYLDSSQMRCILNFSQLKWFGRMYFHVSCTPCTPQVRTWARWATIKSNNPRSSHLWC